MSTLPVSAQIKLSAISGAATDAQDAVGSALRRIKELQASLTTIEDQDVFAATEREIGRLAAKQTEAAKRSRECANLAAQLKSFLRGIPPRQPIEEVKYPKVKLRGTETYSAAVERIRENIAQVQGELANVRRAPLPKLEQKELASAYVAQLSRLGAPKITVEGASFRVSYPAEDRFDLVSASERLLRGLAWLNPEQFAARIHAEIDASPEPALALSAEGKSKRIAELAAQIETLEREEEAWIVSAEGAGLTIARRVNASPAAVLGIALGRAAERKVVAA